MRIKKTSGFTLIEIIIVVAIIGILALVSIPAYTNYITKARRADGQTSLLDLGQRLERYFSDNNTYAGATLALLGMPAASSQGFYTLQITSATATAYAIQAVPVGTQLTNDTQCATLTYNQLGQKGETGTDTAANCW